MASGNVEKTRTSSQNRQETADGYAGVVCQMSPEWRVIRCRDQIQWILQKRKKRRRSASLAFG